MAVRAIQYNIRIDFHEMKDLYYKELPSGKELIPNPFIDVTVNHVTKSTAKKNQVTSASLNESFNFTAALTAEEFSRSVVEIHVFHKYIIQCGLIGSYAFSLKYVYQKAQHWIYRQWIKLCNPEVPAENVGILLVTVGVFGPGDSVPIVDESLNTIADVDASRLNAGPDLKVTFYNLIVIIHKGQDIPMLGGISNAVEPYVKIKHAASSERSKTIRDVNPEWNTTLRLPSYLPCHDGIILIELWNGDTNSIFINSAALDFFELIKNEISPRWINFYWRPPTEGVFAVVQDLITNPELREPNTYGGRLLISASALKVQVPHSKGSVASRVVMEPSNAEYLLWVDLYEASSSATSGDKIQIEIAIGPHSLKSVALFSNELGSYLVDEISGRLDELAIYLPDNETSERWDIFLYVCVSSKSKAAGWFSSSKEISWTRLAWTRISITSLFHLKGKPQWYTLKSMSGSVFETSAVLISLTVGLSKQMKERPPRLEYRLARFYFRAFIYEGLHFPAIGKDKFPNPFIKVDLSSHSIQTSTIKQTLNPSFYEAYEVELMLPENINLAPDITVYICSQNSSLVGGNIILGYFQHPITKIPVEWKKAPEWMDIQSVYYPLCKSKLLVSFELIPAEKVEDDTYPFFSDIRPSTKEGEISLFLVGIRMYQPLNAPTVTVSFGRDVDDTSQSLWSESVDRPIAGSGGNWNFLKQFNVNVSLPKRVQHHSFLEVRIDEKNESSTFNSGHSISCGVAYISLSSLLPWLDDFERKQSIETFRLKMLEDVIIEEAEKALKETPSDNQENINEEKLEKSHKKKKQSKNAVIPYNDPDSANCVMPEMLDYIQLKERMQTLSSKERMSNYFGSAENFAESFSMEKMQSKNINTQASQRLDGFQRALTRDLTKGFSPGEGNVLESQNSSIFGVDPILLQFDLKMKEEDKIEEEQRDEVPYELEIDFSTNDLPYLREPIFRCTATGVPETVGYLKYICSVFEGKDDSEKKKMAKKCEWLMEQYNHTRELIIRAYVLQAKGLVPPSGASNISTYIWIKNANSQTVLPAGLSHNVRDSGNAKRQNFRPEFNRCFQLFCALPDHAVVQISVMILGTISDECIGTTYIDMEDRFFNAKIQQLILEDSMPIELRSLKHEGGTISHGTLRGWYELMTEYFAQQHPPHTLSTSEPDDFEIRIVIWRIKAVPLDDNSQISIFVRGIFQDDEGQDIIRETDTHYNSKDGTGIFNWRFIFPVKIPSRNSILKLQIWNYALLSFNEPIGEANFDLHSDLLKARQRGSIYNIPKIWLSCTHPGHKVRLCGAAEIEVSILSRKEAEIFMVGQGREEPNRNPFLPNVTEHRTYIDWNAIGETVSAAGSAILSGLKWTGVWLTAALIFGAIVFLLVLLN
ncbi:ferlin family protein [Cardiosporidium cionae]|uniref:Ferlin family protein n=1 Tax=Cardiosporidium cionae TaxID=476202 RepID=A0ABQ7J7W4_9APIC|nr:ferlin family protein [Cardiosporidium cionae]|eukprot:KAF8820087.1 ferlin family protein [Cardiosporidium cionae]